MKTNRTAPRARGFAGAAVCAGLSLILVFSGCAKKTAQEAATVGVTQTNIRILVSVSGTVYPENRLEVKPPLAGRVEKVLVEEGQKVYAGETIAYMSSSERAAMLDAARVQGASNLGYWEKIYKPLLIVSPMNGTVIVRNIQPGQTISQSDAAVVISDHLIVQALIDETDIGQVTIGMPAVITLDAYPDVAIDGTVKSISFESKVVNNVTMYQANIILKNIPAFVRSGMSASVDIVVKHREDVLTLPAAAVKTGRRGSFVLVDKGPGQQPEFRPVTIGLSDGTRTEIVSGLSADEKVVISQTAYRLKRGSAASVNPFFPQRPRQTGRGR